MHVFVVSPNVDTFFTPEQLAHLQAAGELHTVKDIKPLADVAELYAGDEPRILAIDPDFCDWTLPNDILDAIPNLQAVCLQTTSFSWVDVEHLKQKGIPVMNLRGFSSIALAEWVVFMTLALARRMPIVVKDGWKLDYEKHRGVELRGKTAGIVGMGRIGTAIAENLAGLGMHVQYWSRQSTDGRFQKVSLEEVMSISDVIVPVVNHNAETEGLITDDMLRSMKPTTLFINVSHPIYNEELLREMATTGKIGGYAFEDEKGVMGDYEGNVWNGPALGWCTNESMSKNAQQWVESIVNAAQGQYPTQVN